MNLFLKFDEYFVVYHQRQEDEKFEINRSLGVCSGLEGILATYFPSIPADVIKVYVKVRTMIRIKAINNELQKLRFKRLNKNKQFLKSFVPEVEPFRPTLSHRSSAGQDPMAEGTLITEDGTILNETEAQDESIDHQIHEPVILENEWNCISESDDISKLLDNLVL